MEKSRTAPPAGSPEVAQHEKHDPPHDPSMMSSSARALALPFACASALILFGLLLPQRPALFWTFVGAGGALLAWIAVLFLMARRTGRSLILNVMVRRPHWIQACAQGSVLLYWGWHVRFVYAFLPLIAAQLIFAYAVDSLLNWSRRNTYAIGFGPFPIIFSINLFLWFRPEWFYWQFAMILVGFAAKEFIRWNLEGRSAHIFNPSSFPLAVASVALIVTATSDITLGTAIATTQFYPPHMYLFIFLISLPGQLLFGVARMTMSAVISLYLISLIHLQITGTYLFYDSHIPLPVFLGMHLLFTDPSTSPRSGSGRVLFGALYAMGTAVCYVLLSAANIPTFYDKLLPVPLMNLMVRGIDRLAAARPPLTQLGSSLTPARRHVVWTSVWAGAFLVLTAARGVGDRHRGQALPFWQEACQAGSDRACKYTESMVLIYCNNGSGWACNEWGVIQRDADRSAGNAFTRACEMGFQPACDNAGRSSAGGEPPVRASPQLPDLPIVLRGTKPPLTERDPARLYAIACSQGWPNTCRPAGVANPF
ncbi:MAG: hypothetical protein ACREL7_09625 [Longimicrobiales bacterium]